jgi:hypothetical protein
MASAPELPPVLPPAGPPLSNPPDGEGPNPSDIPGGLPPFPLPHPPPFPVIRQVRPGCWLTTFKPTNNLLQAFDGTIRVESHPGGRTASGDLYQRGLHVLPGPVPIPVLNPPPNPAAGIPILPRAQYRYYLSITKILEGITIGSSFDLGFNRWLYKVPVPPSQAGTWTNDGAFTARVSWVPAPAGYPSSRDYLKGDVKNAAGIVIGSLTLGWVSSFYRKATLEIDSVPGSERPLDDGTGRTWKSIFSEVGYDFNVIESNTNVTEPSGESWNYAELHAGMLAWRDSANLNQQWRYHLLAVKLLDETERGVMYDAYATDSNKVAREGAAVATHWQVPSSGWGNANNKRWGTLKAAYFRSAVHEIGHAMSLEHNVLNQHFMDTSNLIAEEGETHPPKFWDNIQWSFAENDVRSLRHWPDIFIRPGGTPFGSSHASPTVSPPDNVLTLPDVSLSISPVRGEVPLGAPVRLEVELINDGATAIRAPKTVGLASGYVQGSVMATGGAVRTFRSLFISGDTPMADLAGGDSVSSSITLLRGGDGALFPSMGLFTIDLAVSWGIGDAVTNITASTSVLVTGVESAGHAAAAHKLLTTPDAHLVVIFGGDHLEDGVAAVRGALANDTLRPHYAGVEAKRLATRFGTRMPKLDEAKKLLDSKAVLSHAEKQKLTKLLK